MKRFAGILSILLMSGVVLVAQDGIQAIPFLLTLTNNANAAQTNVLVRGYVEAVKVDQTAGCTNNLTITTDGTPAQTIATTNSCGGDIWFFPSIQTCTAADGALTGDYKPQYIYDARLICTSSNVLGNTNVVSVTVYIRR